MALKQPPLSVCRHLSVVLLNVTQHYLIGCSSGKEKQMLRPELFQEVD